MKKVKTKKTKIKTPILNNRAKNRRIKKEDVNEKTEDLDEYFGEEDE